MKHPYKPALLTGFITITATIALQASPNIILILTDDHGWSQTTYTPDPRVPEASSSYLETVNMSRLANSGMRFSSGYSPAPLCTPTRRSILCGTTTARSGSEFKSDWVPADHMTIPKALRMANPEYKCAHFGKWGEQMISTPEECGYDASDGVTGNNTGGMPGTLGVKGGHDDGPPHFIDNEDPKLTRSVTSNALAFMQDQVRTGNPFYLQVSYYAQHLSVVCTQELLEKYRDKGEPDRIYPQAWAAMMEDLDDGIGRILDSVDALGIADNTYIFFTADNGGRGTVPGGAKNGIPTNYPLTGAKHSLYEGGIRVPFAASGPGIKAGSVTHVPVAGYDFLPTFYDLAGGRSPITELTTDVDGVSFRKVLADPDADLSRSGGALIFHRPRRGFSAIRKGDHKLMLFWKKNGGIDHVELYRVDDNPREEGFNILATEPELADALQSQLLDFLKQVNAETPADSK